MKPLERYLGWGGTITGTSLILAGIFTNNDYALDVGCAFVTGNLSYLFLKEYTLK